MKFYGATDIGRIRKQNEDGFYVRLIADGLLLAVVCDGMGGAAGGEIASSLAMRTFCLYVRRFAKEKYSGEKKSFLCPAEQIAQTLSEAAVCANREVYALSKKQPEYTGMGTTLAGALIYGGTAYCVNVGDSRIYKANQNRITQISKDHSYVQFLVDSGKMTPKEARNSKYRNIITRAVGTDAKVNPDVMRTPAEEGERLLICSDGLSSMLEDKEIYRLISGRAPTKKKVESLIAAANDKGGYDNITCTLIEF